MKIKTLFEPNRLQYFRALGTSFYSSRTYAETIKFGKGLGLGYLLFLIILGTIPLSARIYHELNTFFKERILFPVTAIPDLTIHHGKFIYHRPMPFLIKNQQGDVVSLIDTTGVVSKMNLEYPKLTLLITQNTLYFRPPSYQQFLDANKNALNNPVYTRTLDPSLSGIFSAKQWLEELGIIKLKRLAQIVMVPLIIGFYVIVFGLGLLILSSLVQLYADIFFQYKLSFDAACRLLSVAATPTLLLFFCMKYYLVAIPLMDYVVLLLTYISYGLYSVKRIDFKRT